jgi:hypothetical protein
MKKDQSTRPLTTNRKKATEGQEESCIILKKGERLRGKNQHSNDEKADKNE